MVSYITLTKLARAERSAAELGLERTAGRLQALRRQLESFKHLSEDERGRKAHWAMARIDDTRSCLIQEAYANISVREEHVWNTRALVAATKGIAYIGAIAIYVKIMDALINSGEEAGGLVMVSAMIGVATYAMKRLIESAIGENRFDQTVKAVQRLMDECRAGVSPYNDQHD